MFAGWGGEDDDTEAMDTSDYPWHWFYQAECGIWHRTEDDPVNPISSSELEMFYNKNPYGVINFNTAAGAFKIDFHGLRKTNLRTGQIKKLKRSLSMERIIRCKCADQASSLPAHWENMDSKTPFQAFTVGRGTNEFQEVEKYVQEIGLLREPLKYIYRIQNVDLWELYCSPTYSGTQKVVLRGMRNYFYRQDVAIYNALLKERLAMTDSRNKCVDHTGAAVFVCTGLGKKSQLMRLKGQSDIEEKRLFHGTNKNNVYGICLYNFDCRISDSVRHAHLYGKGTYFALHASYADNYSKRQCQGDTTNTRIMFLARVIVGKYTTGQKNLCKPDGDQIENKHDSCVDNTLYPRMFVIFNSNQIYPEYVLEYGGQ